jgi:CheY-like chemotaxis protein
MMNDQDILDDLTRLNNELVNSQCELARSNAELARLHAVVSEQNMQLEAKVAQRTAVLAKQLALFRALADNAPEVIWIIDGITREAIFANRAWYDLVDGYDMTRAIRWLEQSGHGHTPIFACTAGALAAEEARCVEAGMDDYLVKPVSLATLGERLGRWLPLPRSRESRRPERCVVLASLPQGVAPSSS